MSREVAPHDVPHANGARALPFTEAHAWRNARPTKQVPEKCVTVFRQKPATKQEAKQAKRGRSHASLLRQRQNTGDRLLDRLFPGNQGIRS